MCAQSGGAIGVFNGILSVISSTFTSNFASDVGTLPLPSAATVPGVG